MFSGNTDKAQQSNSVPSYFVKWQPMVGEGWPRFLNNYFVK